MSNSKSNSNQTTSDTKEVKESNILLSKADFASTYGMIKSPCEAKVTVSSVSPELPVVNGAGEQVFDRDTDEPLFKHIVNLKVIPRQHVKAVQELWKGKDELDIAYLNGKTMSINVIIPQSGEVELPFKGQEVSIRAEYLVDKDTGEYRKDDNGSPILIVAGHQFPKLAKVNSFDLNDEIELPELEEEQAA